jgi:hypothetical protein
VHRSPLLRLLATFAVLGGCRADVTAPAGPLSGRYVLVDVSGERLPSAVTTFGSATRLAIADTLYFTSDTEGTQTSVFRNRLPSSDGPVQTVRRPFMHARDGSDIVLAFPCPDPFDGAPVGCTAAPQMRGTLSGDRITFTAAYALRTPQRYVRR